MRDKLDKGVKTISIERDAIYESPPKENTLICHILNLDKYYFEWFLKDNIKFNL